MLSLVGCLFVTFFGSGLRFGGEGKPRSEQSAKTLKNEPQKGHHFQKNSEFFVMFFSLVLGRVLGSVFLRFGGRSVPNGDYLGTLFQHVAAKLES